MKSQSYMLLLALLARLAFCQDAQWIYPENMDIVGLNGDESTNEIWYIGSSKRLSWTNRDGNTQPITIRLVQAQVDGQDGVGGLEDLVPTLDSGDESTIWTVDTGSNLTFSPIFFLNIFYGNDDNVAASSKNFNISDALSPDGTQISSTMTPTTSTRLPTSSTILPTTSTKVPTSSIRAPAASNTVPGTSPATTSAKSDATRLSGGLKASMTIGFFVASLFCLLG